RPPHSLRARWRTDGPPQCRRAVAEVPEGQRLHGADGDAELPRQDPRERRALLRPHAVWQAAAPHRQDLRARRGRRRAPLPRVAAVDGQAGPDSVTADVTESTP